MADTIQITAGSGTVVATDDCGAGGHAQVVKLAIATDGDATPIPATSNGLKVTVNEAFALETGGNLAGINAKLVSGTDIGDVTINNSTGGAAVNIQDGGNAITVDNGGTFAVQATLAAETSKVIGTVNIAASQTVTAVGNVAHAGTDTGNPVKVGGKYNSSGVTLTDGQRGDLQINSNGALIIGGAVANDGPDAGNPIKVGFKNKLFDGSAPGTTVSGENDRADSICDGYGRQYVEITHPNYWSVSHDSTGAETNYSLKAAPGTNLCLFITDIVISNGATAGNITLLDGSGGTVLFEVYPAINGGVSHQFRTPIKLTANTALCETSTTVTTHSVNISGFTAAVTGGV